MDEKLSNNGESNESFIKEEEDIEESKNDKLARDKSNEKSNL